MGVIDAADLMIEKIKADYKNDIDLIIIMGSQVYGETTVVQI